MFKFVISFLLVALSTDLFSQTVKDEIHVLEEDQISDSNWLDNIRAVVNIMSELTEEELEGIDVEALNNLKEMCELDWKIAGSHKLNSSHSKISLPNDYMILIGDEANKAFMLEGEPISENVEACVYITNDSSSFILFEYIKTGYVSVEDWKDINPKEFLESVIENNAIANLERVQNGVTELHVVGWVQEPTLDRSTNTVYFAIEGDSGGEENIVNSVAIRLGRKGVEKLTWVASRSSYISFGGHLDVLLRAHSFDSGYRYKDYTSGDEVAGYGIAALVAATAGGKIVKAGGIAVLLKKFGSILMAGVTALIFKFKNIFKKEEAE